MMNAPDPTVPVFGLNVFAAPANDVYHHGNDRDYGQHMKNSTRRESNKSDQPYDQQDYCHYIKKVAHSVCFVNTLWMRKNMPPMATVFRSIFLLLCRINSTFHTSYILFLESKPRFHFGTVFLV
jgi:hypothetical protein